MNCNSCLDRCKADCCLGPIPMKAELLTRFPQVRPVTHQREYPGGMVLAMHVDTTTRQACCPFLGMDDRCTIYEHRPEVCRSFGNESHPFLTCSFQAKDGRIRSRQERRAIERRHLEGRKASRLYR